MIYLWILTTATLQDCLLYKIFPCRPAGLEPEKCSHYREVSRIRIMTYICVISNTWEIFVVHWRLQIFVRKYWRMEPVIIGLLNLTNIFFSGRDSFAVRKHSSGDSLVRLHTLHRTPVWRTAMQCAFCSWNHFSPLNRRINNAKFHRKYYLEIFKSFIETRSFSFTLIRGVGHTPEQRVARSPCDGTPSASVWPSLRQTPSPSCPYPSDRTPPSEPWSVRAAPRHGPALGLNTGSTDCRMFGKLGSSRRPANRSDRRW